MLELTKSVKAARADTRDVTINSQIKGLVQSMPSKWMWLQATAVSAPNLSMPVEGNIVWSHMAWVPTVVRLVANCCAPFTYLLTYWHDTMCVNYKGIDSGWTGNKKSANGCSTRQTDSSTDHGTPLAVIGHNIMLCMINMKQCTNYIPTKTR